MDNRISNNFDTWNQAKKELHGKIFSEKFFFHEREIWWCSIGLNVGVEINGKNHLFKRPILILKTFNKKMLWGIPITSTIKNSFFSYPFIFDDKKYAAVITQIRAISTNRLDRKIGYMSEVAFKEIRERLIQLIQNETPPKKRGISEPEGNNRNIV